MSFRDKCDSVGLELRPVKLPKPWDFTVWLKEPTAEERQFYEHHTYQQKKSKVATASGKVKTEVDVEIDRKFFKTRLVAMLLCDESGKPEFNDIEAGAAYLNSKGARLTEALYDDAAELAGLKDSDLDELAKNSASSQSADSPTDSPSLSAA